MRRSLSRRMPATSACRLEGVGRRRGSEDEAYHAAWKLARIFAAFTAYSVLLTELERSFFETLGRSCYRGFATEICFAEHRADARPRNRHSQRGKARHPSVHQLRI